VSNTNKYQAFAFILLIAIIVTGSVIIWSKYNRSQPIEIFLPPAKETQGDIYIGGMVNNPGIYPLTGEDNISDIIQSAGGTSAGADASRLELYIPQVEGEEPPQKININRAETWLLEALPGIGETRAQAIISYRQQNGQFLNIHELTSVEGIGTATFEDIKHFITVGD